MTKAYPTFYAALMALGKTDVERAAKIGISYKTIKRLKERIPEPVLSFDQVPDLLRALADDMEAMLAEQQVAA